MLRRSGCRLAACALAPRASPAIGSSRALDGLLQLNRDDAQQQPWPSAASGLSPSAIRQLDLLGGVRRYSGSTSDGQFSADTFSDALQFTNSEILEQCDGVFSASRAVEAAAIEAAKLDVWLPTRTMMDVLELVHLDIGLPWWGAIAATNLLVRTCLVPLTIFMQQKSGKMMEINKAMGEYAAAKQAAAKAKSAQEWERLNSEADRSIGEFQEKNKANMKWAFLVPVMSMANAVVFVSQFSCLKTLAEQKLPSMSYEGLAWFTDLTVPDPYYGLPIACTVITLAMVQLGAMQSEMMLTHKHGKTIKWALTGLAFVFIPMGKYFPAAIAILWFTNSVFATIQSMFLRNQRIRVRLGLPDMNAVKLPASLTAGAGGGAATAGSSTAAAAGAAAAAVGTSTSGGTAGVTAATASVPSNSAAKGGGTAPPPGSRSMGRTLGNSNAPPPGSKPKLFTHKPGRRR